VTVRLAVALACAALAAPVAAAGRSLTITDFAADVIVDRDGTIAVVETIRPRFTGSWNGIYRTIPVEYRTPAGFGYHLSLHPVSATEDGARLRLEASREGANEKLEIWVPGAADSTHVVALRYRVENGLRFFADHDELYWNVTGNAWEVPIAHATARVVLPAGARGVRAEAYTGRAGARRRDASVQVGDDAVTVAAPGALEPGEGLTIVVGWDKGLVAEPGAATRAAWFLAANWPLGTPVLALVVSLAIWYRRGRDPALRPLAVEYAPPGDLTPAEVGTLADARADMRDVSATLVDLAVRGYLTITEFPDPDFHLFGPRNDYAFGLRQPRTAWKSLAPHEVLLLTGMFADPTKDVVMLSSLRNELHAHVASMRNAVWNAILARRYYLERPAAVRARWTAAGLGVGGLEFLAGRVAEASLAVSPTTVAVSAVLAALTLALVGLAMPARTRAGTRALEAVLGFREFLARVDGDHFTRLPRTPETFEKYLPYAIALGLEDRWGKAFDDVYRRPPDWWVGPNGNRTGFRATHFTDDLRAMTAQAGTVFASTPPSASGTSGFGGGFSGGGFGGGGGGGF